MKNQVVMITGGAKGIGRACAEAFLKHGASVSLISRTTQELENAKATLSGKVVTHCG
ncbi:SDR family NAD(P)-dependent oxidoreductase, partial [bacterium]|nr:SDR family NAD(P)-dependent oxidoreductase [bacterium]